MDADSVTGEEKIKKEDDAHERTGKGPPDALRENLAAPSILSL